MNEFLMVPFLPLRQADGEEVLFLGVFLFVFGRVC